MCIIGLLSYIKSLFYSDTPFISDWTELYGEYTNVHLKQVAIDTVVGKIKTASQLVMFNSTDAELNYKLNVRPNNNQNAIEFRNEIIDRLLFEGECLIFMENNNLLIADSWEETDTYLNEKLYKNIYISGNLWRKTYRSSEVYHLKYHNHKFKSFINQLDESYGKLFKRLIDVQMREQQIRVYARFKMLNGQGSQDEQLAKFKKYLSGIHDSIVNDSVAILPRQDDYDVEERSQTANGRSVEEVGRLENMYIRDVANALQVPPLLFSGDLSDISQHNQNFVRWCIRPLNEIIANEFNAKYFTKDEFKDGKRMTVNTVWVIYNSEFEMAKDAEKMVGSAVWTIDDILILQGKKPLNTKVTEQRYLTKNLAPLNDDGNVKMEGGG